MPLCSPGGSILVAILSIANRTKLLNKTRVGLP